MSFKLSFNRASTFVIVGAVLGLPAAAPARAQESWDAVFLKGDKIGYVHTYIEKVREKSRELYRVRQDQVFKIRRLDDTLVMKLYYGTIETPDGEVLRLDTRTLVSDNELRVHGDVVGGKMKLILDGTNQRQEQTIPWTRDIRGPYAAEQSMARKPMEEGEARHIKMYIPDINRVVDFNFTAGPISDVALGDGSTRPLRKVAQTAMLDGKARSELAATLWADSSGQVLKLDSDLMGGIVMYRTTKEGAMSPVARGVARFDQIRSSIIAVDKVIPSPRQTRYVQYRMTLKDEDPEKVFPTDRRQSTKPGSDKNTVILNVQTSGPTDGEAGPAQVDAAYLRPNGMVTSDDEEVRRLAKRAVSNVADPWEQAVRIEQWVARNMKNNFATAFAPASEVARTLTGDCTEHAVLVTAMCRAVGIPSRAAIGMIYMNDDRRRLKGFGFHMWPEVYVNQRWVAVDSSWDQTEVDATHIKLIDTSLEGVSPFEAFLPITRVHGKLEIDPIETR